METSISLELKSFNGNYYADSRDIARAIGKDHPKLLITIRNLCDHLAGSEFGLNEFFFLSHYEDAKGELRPRYYISKKGCDMIANKLTGKKGVLFTAAYVTAFDNMSKGQAALIPTETPETVKSSTGISTAGEIASLIATVRISMERQCSPNAKIAAQTELILRHYGVPVIEKFTENYPFGLIPSVPSMRSAPPEKNTDAKEETKSGDDENA